MLRAIGLQGCALVLCALGAWMMGDSTSARFAALGGAAAIIPNALFALRLALHRAKDPGSYPVVFFLGEMVKIALTIGLLALIVRLSGEVRWLAMLIGLIVVLKAPLAMMFIGARGTAVESVAVPIRATGATGATEPTELSQAMEPTGATGPAKAEGPTGPTSPTRPGETG
ncbi:MAG: ATP synthase subunit I [Burkholderiales bacterium]|nr:MAG: ATP synthase subunit I [Burkholderiales bacterium]